MNKLLLIPLCLFPPLLSAGTLQTAKEVGQKYGNWGYGSDASKQEIDCVQFVLAVVERAKGPQSAEVKKAILVDHGWSSSETQRMAKKLCQSRGAELPDPKMKGVVYALTEASKLGEEVALSDIQAGDLVQYWMYSASQGSAFGHAGVVEKVERGRIWLYGAHKSTDGIGTAPSVGLRLKAPLRAIYAVRLK